MKLILTDVDSVILDYAMGEEWVDLSEEDHDNRVETGLPIFRDAWWGLTYLHDMYGFKYHAISTVGKKHQIAREANLYDHLGATLFKQIDCLDGNECKSLYLKPYENSGLFWFEDSVSNAKIGQQLGLRAVVMNTPWNREKQFDGPRVDNWHQFVQLVEESLV